MVSNSTGSLRRITPELWPLRNVVAIVVGKKLAWYDSPWPQLSTSWSGMADDRLKFDSCGPVKGLVYDG